MRAFQQPALKLNRCEEYYSVGAIDEAGMRFCPAPLAEARPLPKSHAHLPTPRPSVSCGILPLHPSPREVDKDRLKQMKARQNMRASNTGEYERARGSWASSRHAPSPEAGSGCSPYADTSQPSPKLY